MCDYMILTRLKVPEWSPEPKFLLLDLVNLEETELGRIREVAPYPSQLSVSLVDDEKPRSRLEVSSSESGVEIEPGWTETTDERYQNHLAQPEHQPYLQPSFAPKLRNLHAPLEITASNTSQTASSMEYVRDISTSFLSPALEAN